MKEANLSIREQYITGKKSLRELAQEYGRSVNGLRQYACKHGWGKLRKEHDSRRLGIALGPTIEVENKEPVSISISPDWYASQGEKYRKLGEKLLDRANQLLDEANKPGLTAQEKASLLRTASTLVDQGREAIGFARMAPVKSQPAEPKPVEAIPLNC